MSTPMYAMPDHFPIAVDVDGAGPVDVDGDRYDRTMCWCGDDDCELWREP